MTAVTGRAADRVRIAAAHGVCSAPGCCRPVESGMKITKPAGQGWRHLSCEHPYAGQAGRGDRSPA